MAKDEIEKFKRYIEEVRTSDRSAYDREKAIKEYQKNRMARKNNSSWRYKYILSNKISYR